MKAYRGVWAVALVALIASLAITAANIAYGLHLLENGDARYLFLDLVGHPIIWVARLNKAVLPLAAQILRDTSVDEWSRYIKLLGAFFGIGCGALAGLYLALATFGKAVERRKGAFNWKIVRFLSSTLLVLFAAYGLIGIGYLCHFREFLDHPVFSPALATTAGYFFVCLLQYCFFYFIGHYAYGAGQDWLDHRKRKMWQ